jgi:hypothetical protein
MSDSGDEGAGGGVGGDGVKKDFTYKLKAFKRRTLHSIKKKVTCPLETRDAKAISLRCRKGNLQSEEYFFLASDAKVQLCTALVQMGRKNWAGGVPGSPA